MTDRIAAALWKEFLGVRTFPGMSGEDSWFSGDATKRYREAFGDDLMVIAVNTGSVARFVSEPGEITSFSSSQHEIKAVYSFHKTKFAEVLRILASVNIEFQNIEEASGFASVSLAA
ncbi:MAG: hypothetical protein A3B23_03920 [Candidatus Colwellbacteria bacterium RIFCSPLOWO2_01_FULL_48_10]|uniref:Uncharacterized protein n=2 Tax=Bacteria candidate phyla TaxID=1783234 RepID=A0A1F5NZG3_9BACT|nr:MAG: hypothetical protein A2846_01750 [Candidatus Doudnabacteria bacterium RIFCSPHIGHO2_01_FULL_49_9]OGY60098.1 MAG: hypothetical protein A3B23_03920 [Candidatus Colwellbacteria bacterium RIFCSPLOWO2_01_FULL_48_10]